MLRAKDERLQIRLQPELKQLLQEVSPAWASTLGIGEGLMLPASLTVEDGTVADAVIGATLLASTRRAGLSFVDRACLALARRLGVPVLTTDRSWARLDVGATGVEVRMIRHDPDQM